MVQRAAAEKLHTNTIKPTGLSLLDKALGGGLLPGSVVYVSSDPATDSEVLLYHFTQPRKTLYFACAREPKYMIQDMKRIGFDVSRIEFVDVFSIAHHHSLENIEVRREALKKCIEDEESCSQLESLERKQELLDYSVLDFVDDGLKNVKEENITIIIDAFHILPLLHVGRSNILELMHNIYNTAKERNAIAYLFSLRDTMDKKMENELMGYCDVVFDMRFMKHEEAISNELAITKARNIKVANDIIKFFIKGRVVRDPSEVIV